MVSIVVFGILLAAAVIWFARNMQKIRRNILLGQDIDRSDRPADRWKTMLLVAIGQQKMITRPVSAIFHIFLYVGFVVINLEVLEIVLDGVLGTHRLFAGLGSLYYALIASFEVLALLVLVGCVVFLVRRNVINLKRFRSRELTGWPRSDANFILIIEILLMGAFLFMNAADGVLMSFSLFDSSADLSHYKHAALAVFGEAARPGETHYFPVSQWLTGMLPNNINTLILIERSCWWFHIVGILAFLNYLPYSKHFHIMLSFPNVYYSNLNPKGSLSNLESVTREVKLMMDPSLPPPPADAAPPRFGAKDVPDLNWVQLLNAYTCTECGRCTSVCPANQTGKLLSPRKIMMDTRDRMEDMGKVMDANKGAWVDDGKALLGDYILPEEVWACTTCNACTEACPVNIDPLSIIVDLRRYLVMEQSAAPASLNMMFTNLENNGAPWQFSQADRLNWAQEN
jgi:ferredoxin